MKTKFCFLILTTFFALSQLVAQEYHPLLNNSSWTVEVYDFGFNQTFTINPSGEATIRGYTYKKFTDSVPGNEIFIREDASSKKVYKIINGQDVLLFDFNLGVSSPITLSNGQNYIVTSIANINVNGGQRKMFYLRNQSTFLTHDEIWIEGIGNAGHPLLARYEYPSDPTYVLKCSYQNGAQIYNMGLANNDSPSNCDLLGTTDETFDKQTTIFPNPFQQELTIITETNLKNASLKIFNLFGQEIRTIKNISGNKIVVKRENLISGVYIIKIQNENKTISRKITVSN